MSSSVVSMKKWGIPDQKRKAPEITLLERLVWVRYQTHWWPALLYLSYTELQQHMYDQLDMVLKAQFAMAIMRQMQEKKKVMVARLLGRSILEVIEVEEDCYCEFYWQLPNVLPMACKRSRYGDNAELYFDFHRALDQVEDIIREVSEENFALLPNDEKKSWLERAHAALDSQNDERSSVSRKKPVPTRQSLKILKAVPAPQETREQQRGQQRLPDVPNNTSLESKSSTIATNDVGLWDTMMTNISRSYESLGNNEEPDKEDRATKANKKPATMPRQNEEKPLQPTAQTSQPTANKATKKAPPSNFHETPTQSFNGRSHVIGDVKKTCSRMSHASSISSRSHSSKIPTASNLQKPRKMKTSVDTSSRRSGMTKKSGSTEQINNLTSKKEEFETRDPPSEPAAQSTPSTAMVVRQTGPIDILPGLEGDDIMPGLSQKVEHARDIWIDVLSQMLINKESDDPSGIKHVGDRSTLPELREGATKVMGDAQQKDPEARVCVEATEQNLSFWQRMTCDAIPMSI